MAIRKSELYTSLWTSCDELRGGMDASQYKDYVLFMLFIKYVSGKLAKRGAFSELERVNKQEAAVQDELERVSQTLTGRIRQLASATPGPCRNWWTRRWPRYRRGWMSTSSGWGLGS